MVQGTILRPQTELEKTQYKEMGSKDFQYEFRKKLITKEQEYVKAHKPFCYRCAKMDFEDKISTRVTESGRMSGDLTLEQIKSMKIDIGDLDDYGKPEKFTKHKDNQEVIENKIMDGIRTPVVVGHNKAYKCKQRGCIRTIFIPLEKQENKIESFK